MFRLLLLLSISMFLVLLIGGEDRGQMRHGLIAAAPEEEPAEGTQLADTPAPPASGDVNLASFVPLSPPVPEPAVQRSKPAPEPVVEAPIAVAAPEAELQPVALLPEPEPEPLPLLFVNSNAINVRQGPSTSFAVVGRLTRDEAVLAIEPEQNGWVRIRIEGDGVEGFVAARLLTDRDPSGN
jgi:hypothetical protein